MSGSYRAQPVSRPEIRRFVKEIKSFLNLENEARFPIVRFLELGLPLYFSDFELEVADARQMFVDHGETFPDKHFIRIREDVYLRAAAGEPRDRMTIAHEIGHLFLHAGNAVSLCRLAPDEKLKAYEDPEWQANAFGGEMLAPSYLIKGLSVEEVMRRCNVSESAAINQLKHL